MSLSTFYGLVHKVLLALFFCKIADRISAIFIFNLKHINIEHKNEKPELNCHAAYIAVNNN